MINEQLYKLAFELAIGDMSKCPEDCIYYNPENGEEVRIRFRKKGDMYGN